MKGQKSCGYTRVPRQEEENTGQGMQMDHEPPCTADCQGSLLKKRHDSVKTPTWWTFLMVVEVSTFAVQGPLRALCILITIHLSYGLAMAGAHFLGSTPGQLERLRQPTQPGETAAQAKAGTATTRQRGAAAASTPPTQHEEKRSV